MGNTQAKAIKGWKSVNKEDKVAIGHPVLVREMSSLIGEMYEVELSTQYSMEQHMEVYKKRRESRSGHLVEVYDVEVKDEMQCGGDYQLAQIITEHIPIRLKNQRGLTTPQAAYIVEGALKGYQELQEQMKSNFLINDQMIGVSDNGKVKVWINENFARNQPTNIHFNNSEQDAINQIIHCVNAHTGDQNQDLKKIGGMGLESFTTAIPKYSRYLNSQNRKIIARSLISPSQPFSSAIRKNSHFLAAVPQEKSIPILMAPVKSTKNSIMNKPQENFTSLSSINIMIDTKKSITTQNNDLRQTLPPKLQQQKNQEKNITGSFWYRPPQKPHALNYSTIAQQRRSLEELNKTNDKLFASCPPNQKNNLQLNLATSNHKTNSLSFPSTHMSQVTPIHSKPISPINFLPNSNIIQDHGLSGISFSELPKTPADETKPSRFHKQKNKIKFIQCRPETKREFLSRTTDLSAFPTQRNRSFTGEETQKAGNKSNCFGSYIPSSSNSQKKNQKNSKNPNSIDYLSDNSFHQMANSNFQKEKVRECMSHKAEPKKTKQYMESSQTKRFQCEPYKVPLSNQQNLKQYGNSDYEETARFGKPLEDYTDYKALYSKFKPFENEKFGERMEYLKQSSNKDEEKEKRIRIEKKQQERSDKGKSERERSGRNTEREGNASSRKTPPSINEEEANSQQVENSSDDTNTFMQHDPLFEQSSERREESKFVQFPYDK